MGELIDLNNYRRVHGLIRRAHAEMLDEAAAAIERITGFGCMHEVVKPAIQNGREISVCWHCRKVLSRRDEK